MGLDDLYNNFKIVEQKVKRTVAVNNDDKNLAFLTTSSPSSTNPINTVNTGVSTGSTKVNTASTETSTASFSDATVYAFLSTQPQGSQLVHEDLEQIHDDDLEEMDLKWNNMAPNSQTYRARKFYQRTGRKIIIDGSSTAGYDKSKKRNQGNSSKAVRIEDASEKAMCAIDALKKQYDDLLVKLDDTAFKASTYKRGLSILEAQVVKYKESEVLFSEEIALLKRSVGHKDYLMGLVKTELEKVKEEKEGFEFKLAKFEKSSKDLDNLLASLEEFKQPEVNEYGPRDSSLKPTNVCNRESNNSKENTDDSLTQQPKTDWVSDDEEEVESIPKEEKKADVPIATKKESVKTVNPSRRSVRYAEMYRSQRPRGNHRSWNGHKSSQLGCNFVFNNKACFICGNFDHIQYNCPNAYKHMVPRAVLMRTGLKTVKNAKPLSTVRSVNTVRPVSTARFVNTVRPYNTAHPKPTVSCAKPKTHFQNQAQRPFYKNTTASKQNGPRGFNAVEAHMQVGFWRPIKPNGASLTFNKYNYIDARGRSKSVMAWVPKGGYGTLVDEQMRKNTVKGIKPAIGFMKPFGCHVTILNTLDKLGKFDGKSDEGFFVGYSLSSKAFRVYNIRTRKVVLQKGLFLMLHLWQDDDIDDHQVNTASPQVNTGSRVISTATPEVNTATSEGLMGPIPTTKDTQVEDQELELGNISPSYEVSSTPHTRIHKIIN
ncbi:retrovirus-related pol polyprotein from transposon TNT 1-94 [Tanacetum coccineum]|uniref:Retrovirus-related pol polyprotein from transposon TNT 1-94 n=1 Tax=Tanacetum coccineum TaxID=301880 RepID=A0ABQ5AJA0_9ASTR